MKDKKLCKYCRRIAVSLALLTAVSIADSTSVFASEKADQLQSIETSANTNASSDMVKDSSSSVNGNDSAASSTDETNSTSVSKGTQNAVSQQSKADVAVSDANSVKSDSKTVAVASVANSSQPQNGWWKDEDYYWYYFENGNPVKDKLKTIGNYTYYFLSDGKMDTNDEFSYTSGLGDNYYRVDGQGHLVKGWYKDDWVGWYYYDKKTGQAITGLQTIDNQKYYFYSGCMFTDGEFEYQNKYYRADENGHLVKGWYKDDSGEWYYYDNNGVRVSGYRPINGKGYYFDSYGQMINDDKAHIFDGVFYYINGSGIVLKRQAITKDEWVQVGNDWYYVKNYYGGEFLSDETATLGGRTYHFDRDGKMSQNCSVIDHNQKNGWWEDEDHYWYYFENGNPVKDKLKTIGNYTYYFLSDGKMDTNDEFSYTSGLGDNYYRVDGQGHLVKGWYKDDWVGWYYYDKKTGQAITGLQTIDNQKYYFYSGCMFTDGEFEYQNKYYRADENGHLVKGWYKDDSGEWYYYDNNGVRVSGYRPINGKGYYFDSYGQMINDDKAHIFDGVFYYINGSGIVLKRQAITKDEWVQVGNDWYYVKNYYGGEFLSDETATLGGRTYHFDRDGKMFQNRSVIDYNQSMLYYYGSDGAFVLKKTDLYKDEWVKSGNNWYYVKDRDLVKSGEHQIDGRSYHFDKNGVMSKNYATVANGVFYYFGSNGDLSKKQNVSKDGWVKAGNYWYYVKNKVLVKGKFITLGKYTYYMYGDGKMACNTVVKVYNSSIKKYVSYRVDKQGHVLKYN